MQGRGYRVSNQKNTHGDLKKKLNRGRWEERETKAYLAVDPVDADFPGVTMVIRTFRRTWEVVWKGERDSTGGNSVKASTEKGKNRTAI